MKKHLIAAAVAAAVVAPAFAQNVTLYGRIDGGYTNNEYTTTTGSKVKSSGVDYSTFTSSRIGITGTEDLGGGLKASFTMEGEVAQGETASTTATVGYSNLGFGRQLNASISGGFGSVLVGKTDSMYKAVFDAFDAGYSNNMPGAADGLVGDTTADATALGNHLARRDVTIRYTSPAMSGFSISAGMTERTTDTAGAASKVEDNSGYEIGVRYSAGPLSAAIAYRDADTKAATIAPATNFSEESLGVGLSYDFGVATVFAQYFDHERQEEGTGAVKKTDELMAIGVRVPLGATTLFASYTDGEYKNGTVAKTDLKGYQVGAKYDLSKRTYLYAAYGDQERKRTGVTKAERDEFGIGIAHHF